jgi:hypothetical protein
VVRRPEEAQRRRPKQFAPLVLEAQMIRNLMISAALSLGALTMVANTALAADPAPKKEEMKCDKAGKSCKDGADCKVENCKKEENK